MWPIGHEFDTPEVEYLLSPDCGFVSDTSMIFVL